MPQDLQQTIALLERTPKVLDAWLRGLPGVWTAHNEGGETWNVFEILGHLVHGERSDWMVRARTILEAGASQVFAPFNRLGHVEAIQGKTLDQLLDEFADARAENLAALRALNLQPEQLSLQGQHPAFGVVTLGQLLATWAVHDLTHLHQVSRVMAYQYRETVGPWSEYLGVLQK